MAYIDKNLEFSDAQVLTTTAISTNVYDTASVKAGGAAAADLAANIRQDLGNGDNDLWLVVTCNGTFAGGTSLAVTFETADDAALTTNATVLLSSGVVALAGLTAGTTLIAARIPSALYRRYIGARYTIVGTMSGGGSAVDAYLTNNPQSNRIYKSGFTVQ